MARDIFVDTSGFYAILVADDDRHTLALDLLAEARKARRRFVTTDHVIDETATLLKMRRLGHLAEPLFERLTGTRACRIEWTNSASFLETQRFFLKHADQAWSFTDCLSYRVMKDLRLREALTKDHHFEQAGFQVLLK